MEKLYKSSKQTRHNINNIIFVVAYFFFFYNTIQFLFFNNNIEEKKKHSRFAHSAKLQGYEVGGLALCFICFILNIKRWNQSSLKREHFTNLGIQE
jgi:hypothetical protein